MPNDHNMDRNHLDTATEDGPTCFMDASRVCNAACVAFSPSRPAGAQYSQAAWAHCTVIVNLRKTADSLDVIARKGTNL